MNDLHTTVFSVLALCTLLSLAALLRQRWECERLRKALQAASEAERTQSSLLTQRSELDTIKDEFISTVSHELRTPLTSIRGALGLLSAGLMGSMDSRAQNLLRIALTNTDRLIRLINDILDLERMESGRAPLYIRRCSLGELAMQATETMAALADTSEVRLEILVVPTSRDAAVADDLPDLFFEGDPDRILQVLTNLLSNAIKFSPPKSTVRLELDPGTGESLTLRVRDQGRGIPADKLESVFERFSQVEASDARQKGGTGLGLAICRSIVQQHNGRIWAESNSVPGLGRGACLVVALPRATRTPAGVRVRPSGSSGHAAEGTILLCEQDPELRVSIASTLRLRGYAVLETSHGGDLLEKAAEGNVKAVLLEVGRPGLLGWDTLRQLKGNPVTASVPVLVLSTLPPMRRSGELPGHVLPEGWVTKPLQAGAVLAELARVLKKSHGPAQVLLVEDDDDLADVIVANFVAAQVRVEHAATYSDALLCCTALRPDLLILDLELPDGDGFTLVDWLRQQPELRTLPLVVYSGRELSDEERAQLRLGPTQFLTKAKVQPGEVEELVFKMVQTLRPAEQDSPTAALQA